LQDLADDQTTEQQIRDALHAGTAQWRARFELYNADGILQGDLETVTKASVENNIDRAIKRTLSLEWAVTPATPTIVPFQTRIKPYLGIWVAGRWREWPQGLFLATVPDRDVTDDNIYSCSAMLHETGGYLLASSRPVDGVSFGAGTAADQAIRTILDSIGLTYGPFPADPNGLAAVTFSADDNWYEVINSLCATNGWYSLWFDGDGVAQITPIPNDYTLEPAAWTYSTDDRSIVVDDVGYAPNIDRLANRVLVRASNADVDDPLFAVVTLEDVSPAHPYSHTTLGFFIDKDPVDDNNASTVAQLQTQGENLMVSAGQTYQRVEVPTRANPTHETFEIIEFQYVDDAGGDFDTAAKYHERGWTLDLVDGGEPGGAMNHALSRIVE